jgi:hypothetical protein
MRSRTSFIPIVLGVLALTLVLLASKGGPFNVRLQHRIMDGPRRVETTIVSPRDRRWVIDRHIVWPDQCPPNGPCP